MITEKGIRQSLGLLYRSNLDKTSIVEFLSHIPPKVLESINDRQNIRYWQKNFFWEVDHCGNHVQLTYKLDDNEKMLNIYYFNQDWLHYLAEQTSTTLLSYFESDGKNRIKKHQLFKILKTGEKLKLEQYTSYGSSYDAKEENLEL